MRNLIRDFIHYRASGFATGKCRTYMTKS